MPARNRTSLLIPLAFAASIAVAAKATGQQRNSSALRAPLAKLASDRRPQDSLKTARSAERARESAGAIAAARKLAAAGDTMKALGILAKAAELDQRNGPLLFEWGNLLTEKSRPAWRRFLMPSGIPNMIIKAESVMAVAMVLEPDSAHYAIPYGRLLWSTNIFSAGKASGLQLDALTKLDSTSSPARYAEAADQFGIIMWRRWETNIGAALPGVMSAPPERMNGAALAQYIKEAYVAPKRQPGLLMYQEAVDYFRKARSLDPDNELYFRHEMMALSDFARWDEMAAQSRERMRDRPAQPWPWLVLGIAEHRRGHLAAAEAAFDSGLTRMSAADRNRLQMLSMILPRKQQRWFDSLGATDKEQIDKLFWNSANPSFLLPANPLHSEFLARTVYSELRFTDDEARRNGADSDMGEIFVRYGPPERIVAVLNGQMWTYFRENMTFSFEKLSLYGTARLSAGSWIAYDSIVIDRPAAFTNLPILRNRIDSVSTQVARFRAANDSIDMAIFAGFRLGALRRRTPLETSTVRQGVFFVDMVGDLVSQVLTTTSSSERDSMVVAPRSWYVRTSPEVRAVRVEALEPDLLQAARSLTQLGNFPSHGFGVSDLLVVATAALPASSANNGQRWTDYNIAPLTASRVSRGEPVTLLWETYETANNNGVGRVRIGITVERESDSGLIALAGRIVSGVRGAVTGSRGNAVTMTYDREFGSQPVIVDAVAIQLGRLDSGRYRVTLNVTDLVSNLQTARVQRFTIDRGER